MKYNTMKNFKRCAIILIVVLAIASTMVGTYAIYSSDSNAHGLVTAKAFSVSSSFQENIQVQIWLGETQYWYFTAENTRNGNVATSNVDLYLAAELKSIGKMHIIGLEVTLEEYVTDINTEKTQWRSATNGKSMSLDDSDPKNYFFGQSATCFIGYKAEKKQFRLKFTLPDRPDTNGFYKQDFDIVNRKSAVDLYLTYTESL